VLCSWTRVSATADAGAARNSPGASQTPSSFPPQPAAAATKKLHGACPVPDVTIIDNLVTEQQNSCLVKEGWDILL
jgi:hypothetical protein